VKLGMILWQGLDRANNPAREASSALLRRVSNRKPGK
jgi:hypothetical protein